MVSAFTDHLAVFLRINLEASLLQRGRGLCKMNTKVLRNTTNSSRFVQDLTRRKLQERKYLDVVTWELNMSHAKIRFLFV